jgi:hypothetical protein
VDTVLAACAWWTQPRAVPVSECQCCSRVPLSTASPEAAQSSLASRGGSGSLNATTTNDAMTCSEAGEQAHGGGAHFDGATVRACLL